MNPSVPSQSFKHYNVRRNILVAGVMIIILAFGMWLASSALSPQPSAPIAVEREIPAINLPEAQAQISFAIPKPEWLPEALILKGSHVNPPDWAQTFYGYPEGGDGGLGIEATRGGTTSQYDFPDEAKQPVTIDGQSGVCIAGGWDENLVWNNEADSGALEWAADGFFYHIGHSGLVMI
jgi:hypothetical protein